MNILIIGATRGIGRRLVEQALEKGHTVTALVRRDPDRLDIEHERLNKLKGDILDTASVEEAAAGQDAICSTIGVKPLEAFKTVTVFSEGTKNVLEAMHKTGVRRFICITGIGAGDSRGHGGFLYDKLLLPLPFKKVYDDKDRQEAIIKASDVDWVIVRPAFLTNGPLTRKYRALIDLEGVTAGKISRADVAHFMLNELDYNKFLRQTPLLTY
jgi:putative NADH-flavin reductase